MDDTDSVTFSCKVPSWRNLNGMAIDSIAEALKSIRDAWEFSLGVEGSEPSLISGIILKPMALTFTIRSPILLSTPELASFISLMSSSASSVSLK